MNGDDEPIHYAVRVTERANRDIDATHVYLADQYGEKIANKWRQAIIKAILGLSFMPERYPYVPEEYFRVKVRHYIWRRTGSTLAYRILYKVETQSEDAFVVRVIHVRSTSRGSISSEEAREIEAQQQ